MLVIADLKNYDHIMASGMIEKLLEKANSSSTGDTSVNVARHVFAVWKQFCKNFLKIDEEKHS